MGTGDRPRVSVFFSHSDTLRSELKERLAEAFDVVPLALPAGSFARGTVVRATSDVDVAVVVLPASDDPALGGVMFEAGTAAGAGVPLLVIGDVAEVPSYLAPSVVIGAERLDTVAETVARMLGRRNDAVDIRSDDLEPPLTSDYASSWTARMRQVSSEQEALPLISELFARTGARIRDIEQASGSSVHRADLVIWDDNLAATVGMPLPIEVLLRWRSWPAVRARLEQTLTAAGSKTLLALVLEEGNPPRVWTDGRRVVLAASAISLAEELAVTSLPGAIDSLLETAIA